MKLLLKYTILLSACIALLFAPSCQTTCDAGYEGKRCDVPWRNKFKGVWSAHDTSGAITLAYLDTITDGNEVTDVFLSRAFSQNQFYKFVRATINDNSINIASQKPDVTKIYVEGTGTLNSDRNTIVWNYKLINKYGAVPIDSFYTGVWTKQ